MPRAASSPRPRAVKRVPEPRIYAVGDIHGCAAELSALHELIRTDARASTSRSQLIIYLGDFIDRGPDSRSVLDALIRDPLPGFACRYLKGNHEDTLLRFLDGADLLDSWLTYGGAATLLSYGVRPPIPGAGRSEVARVREELARALPADHLAFLRGLELSIESQRYFFVHAGLRPGIPFAEQTAQDIMYIRREFLESNFWFGKRVVHGHDISGGPDVHSNRIGVDTGAFATGHLTCLVADRARTRFLST